MRKYLTFSFQNIGLSILPPWQNTDENVSPPYAILYKYIISGRDKQILMLIYSPFSPLNIYHLKKNSYLSVLILGLLFKYSWKIVCNTMLYIIFQYGWEPVLIISFKVSLYNFLLESLSFFLVRILKIRYL